MAFASSLSVLCDKNSRLPTKGGHKALKEKREVGYLFALLFFAKPIAKPVWGDDEENPKSLTALGVVVDRSDLVEAVRDEFVTQGHNIIRTKGTAVLLGVAAIFRQRHLNTVAFEHNAVNGALLAPLLPEEGWHRIGDGVVGALDNRNPIFET